MRYWRTLQAFFGSGDNDYAEVRADASTHTLQTIDYPHHEIHAGSHFYIEGYTTLGVAGTLAVKLETADLPSWGHFVWEINSSGILTTTLDEDATGGMAGGSRPTIHANNRNMYCWTGMHTGGANAATLTDSTKAWADDELVGLQVFNSSDGSSGVITANDATTVTASLAGGTDNDWDLDDTYEINKSRMTITSGVSSNTGYTQRVSNTSFGSKSAGGGISRVDELILKQNTIYCRVFTSAVASNVVGFKANWYEHENKS